MKCVAIPLYCDSIEDAKAFLSEHVATASLFTVKLAGDYLGFSIGTRVQTDLCVKQFDGYVQAALSGRNLGEGLTERIIFYNSRALSKLGYVMQLQWRPARAVRAESLAISILCACPFNSLPNVLVIRWEAE